jgi:hypothetical protein
MRTSIADIFAIDINLIQAQDIGVSEQRRGEGGSSGGGTRWGRVAAMHTGMIDAPRCGPIWSS